MSLILTIAPCLAIFFYYLFNRVRLASKCSKIVIDTNRVINDIKKIEPSLFKAGGVLSKQTAHDLRNELESAFLNNGLIEIWNSAKLEIKTATIDFKPKSTSESSLKVLRKFEDLFNPYDFLNRKCNLDRVQSLPNQFTGFGLLFTFAGLSFGIYQGAQSITLVDASIADSIQSLSPLIQAAGISFLTSLTGLACSLEFSNFERKKTHSVEGSMLGLFDELYERIDYISDSQMKFSEQVTSDIQNDLLLDIKNSLASSNLNDTVNNFDVTLKEFMEMFTDNLKAHEDKISADLKRSLDSHNQIIDSINVTFSSLNSDLKQTFSEQQITINDRVEKSDEFLSSILDKHTKVANNLEEICNSLDSIAENDLADKLSKSFSEMIENTNKDIREQFKLTANDTINSYKVLSEDVSREILSKLECQQRRYVERYENLESSVTSLLEMMPGCINNLVELNNTYHKGLSNLSQTSNNTYDVVNSIRNIKNDFISINKSTNDSAKDYQLIHHEILKVASNISELNTTLLEIKDTNHLNVQNSAANDSFKPDVIDTPTVKNTLLNKLFRAR